MNEEEKIKVSESLDIQIGKKKKLINAKTLIKGGTLLLGALLIIVMTITDITISAENFSWFDWITKSLITTGIMIFGLLMGESIGNDRQTQKGGGLYQTNLNAYEDLRESLKGDEGHFSQWYTRFKEQRLAHKRVDLLVERGFDFDYAELLIGNCNDEDYEKLRERPLETKDGKAIMRLTEAQYKSLQEVMEATKNFKAPSYTFYLTAFGANDGKDILEEPARYEKERRLGKGFNRAWKIAFSLFISMLLAMLTVQDFMGGDDPTAKMQAWVNLINRLTSLATAFCSGWSSSALDVKLMAQTLENKTKILGYFKHDLQTHEFTYRTYDEIARDALEEWKKQHAPKVEETPETPLEPQKPPLESKEGEEGIIPPPTEEEEPTSPEIEFPKTIVVSPE